MTTRPGTTTVGELLRAVGEPFLALGSGAADTPVCGLAILDPQDQAGGFPQELVLVVGVRGRRAARVLRTAARRGASAVAVKVHPGEEVAELRAAAQEAGIALLTVAPEVRWDQLEARARAVVDGAALADAEGDLFDLAETVAALTSGIVSIEDSGNRVLAYSRSDERADELRRLSILGWQGPEEYLGLLREWGVFQRLRSGEEVVRVAERPELGIRRRLAVGIHSAAQFLGVIWVQEAGVPLAEQAEHALLGAARLAAAQLLRHRGTPGSRAREDLIAGLLDGRASADLVAGRLGLDPASPAVVVAFAVPGRGADRPAREWGRTEIATVASVHVTAYRRDALVATSGQRIYAVLPGVAATKTERALVAVCAQVVDIVRRRTGAAAQAGIGSPVRTLAEVATSRAEADRVLDTMARDPSRPVATLGDLRAEVLLTETLDLVGARPELRDPAVAELLAHDRAHGTELAPSVLAHLEAFGDVRSAAATLHVHPNTLRHRLRRAGEVAGIDLADPRERLLCHLHLLLHARRNPS